MMVVAQICHRGGTKKGLSNLEYGGRAPDTLAASLFPYIASVLEGRFGIRDVLDALPSRHSLLAVRDALRTIVDAEGPVHQERLAKLACAAFNLNKMNADRANSVLDALDHRFTAAIATGSSGTLLLIRRNGLITGPTGRTVDRASPNTSESWSFATRWSM